MDNPSMERVVEGDKFIGGNFATVTSGFAYESVVLKVYPIEKRFGNDDRIVEVCVRSINLDGSVRGIVDYSKLIWYSHLAKGLV